MFQLRSDLAGIFHFLLLSVCLAEKLARHDQTVHDNVLSWQCNFRSIEPFQAHADGLSDVNFAWVYVNFSIENYIAGVPLQGEVDQRQRFRMQFLDQGPCYSNPGLK